MTYRSSPQSFIVALAILAAVMLAPSSANAQTFTIGPIVDTSTQVNVCTGETVLVTAITKMFFYTKTDSSGGTHLANRTWIHGQGQVVDPVTLVPAATPKYRFNNENLSEGNVPSSGSLESTLDINYVLVRQGNDPTVIIFDSATNDDFKLKETVHLTINPNLVVTADVTNGHSECPTR